MAASMRTAIVVGNPKPRSRTYEAANIVIEKLSGQPADLNIDLADFGATLLDWTDTRVTDTIREVQACDLVVFASPTYKATYTGLLKLYLDRIDGGALAGVSAVPLMLGAHWRHALAPELLLKPVLVELGATCPTQGLFLLDSEYTASDELERWLDRSRPQLPMK
jgi:FMN reductase